MTSSSPATPAAPPFPDPVEEVLAELSSLYEAVLRQMEVLDDACRGVHSPTHVLDLGETADRARLLVARVRDLDPGRSLTGLAVPPLTQAVTTAASALDAAGHALGPRLVAEGAGGTSLRAARRFLRLARGALLDTGRLIQLSGSPADGTPDLASGQRPSLRLVPNPDPAHDGGAS